MTARKDFSTRRRVLVAALSLAVSSVALAQNVLRVSAIPDEAPTELQRKFAPLGEYLEREIGMRVDGVSAFVRRRQIRSGG